MIICCGEALVDMVRLNPEQGFLPLPGGSPYNTAIAIGRLGVAVKFLGRFSTDFFGDMLVKKLRENQVGDDLIVRSPQNTTLAFVKLEEGKEPQYIFYTEGTADRSFALTDVPAGLDAHCIVFGSIAMTMEPAASTIETVIQREKNRGTIISFDPNIRPLMILNKDAYLERLNKWLSLSTIAKISSVDFEYIYPGLTLEQALTKVLSLGPYLAICTLGAQGSLAFLRRGDGSVIKVSAPVVDLPVTDTIGAGDTCHGAFLSWLEINGKMSRLSDLSESELYEALFFANKAASIVCSRRGADPPTLQEVEK
jgi:fructokinase